MNFVRRLATPRNIFLIALGIAWAALRFAFGTIEDDAFITFRYARNLVEGVGFVFNPGERVCGTTSPLYGLIIALGMRLGAQPWTWALALDVPMLFLILWRMRQMMEATGGGRWFWLAGALAVGMSPLTIPVAGMESAWFLAAAFGALSAAVRQRRAVECVAWGTLAALVRPDGVAALGVVGTFALWPAIRREDRREILIGLSPALLLVAQAAVLWAYYGSPIPQSLLAKSVATRATPFSSLFAGAYLKVMFAAFGRFHPLGLAGIAGFIMLARRRDHAPITAFYVAYVLFFAAGRAPDFYWYHTPHLLLLCMFAARALGAAAEWGMEHCEQIYARRLSRFSQEERKPRQTIPLLASRKPGATLRLPWAVLFSPFRAFFSAESNQPNATDSGLLASGAAPDTRPGSHHAAAAAGAAFVLAIAACGPQIPIYAAHIHYRLAHYGITTNQKMYRDAAAYIAEHERAKKDTEAREDGEMQDGKALDGKEQAHDAKDGAPVIAAHEIGHLGYFSQGRIFDLEGLVTPAVSARLRRDFFTDRLGLAREAEWFVHPFAAREGTPEKSKAWHNAARHGFRPVKTFAWPAPDRGVTVIFHREDKI